MTSTAGSQPGAAILFARDFLSAEFTKLASLFGARTRVYITMNAAEAEAARGIDPSGEVWTIGSAPPGDGPIEDGDAIDRDRTLRYASLAEIALVRRAVADVIAAVLARHPAPAFYFDEPVSGYANEAFNRAFGGAGALCCHFQTAWLPGYLFVVSDAGQDRPVPLGLVSGGAELAKAHLASRASGGALPLYVLSYGKASRRVKDLALTLGKAAYRKLRRRNASYIDRSLAPHLLHARALAHSLTASYSPDPVGSGGTGNAAGAKTLIFPLHYEPESLLAYFSPYYRQEEIAAQLLDSLPPDWTLVLKEHPSQPGALHLPKWAELRSAARVVCLPGAYPAARLLALRPTVMSLGSTFALEAALAGCPVGVLGTVHFQHAPGITKLAHPGDWVQLADAPRAAPEAITAWYGEFLDTYAFKGNFMKDRTWIEDAPALVAALGRVAGR